MNNAHIDNKEFEDLLFGEAPHGLADRIAAHVETCELCNSTMCQMAATPENWSKATELINVSSHSNVRLIDKGSELGTTNTDSIQALNHGSKTCHLDYPVDQLFEAPKHPEMMGRIGDYDVECEIGRGGMGVVFKAHDAVLNRPIAIKVLAPHLAANGAARKRFSQEGRAAASILHPNVIAIHGVSKPEETPYLIMPFIRGPSLQSIVDQSGPLPLKDTVRIAMQIAAGLTSAHSQSVIHRDIKPANILIENQIGRAIVTDFGLARAGNDASTTKTGWIAGTPNFMSPEQANGVQVDARSDLFSMGSLIYFMATGHLPFRAELPMAILNRICNDEPTAVREVNAEVSQTLADVIDKLLEKKPASRFQSAAELHQILESYLAHLNAPTTSRPPVVRKQPARIWPVGWSRVAAFCLVAALITASAWLVFEDTSGLASPISNQKLDDKNNDRAGRPPLWKSDSDLQAEMDDLAKRAAQLRNEIKRFAPNSITGE